MDHPNLTVSNFMEHFIVPKMINEGRVVEFVICMGDSFRIIPEFRILRLTFYRKSASKSLIRQILMASLI